MKHFLLILSILFNFILLNAQSNEILLKEITSNDMKVGKAYLIENSLKKHDDFQNNQTFEIWTRTEVFVMNINNVRYNNASIYTRNIIDCENQKYNHYDIMVFSKSGNFIESTHVNDNEKSLVEFKSNSLADLISKEICISRE